MSTDKTTSPPPLTTAQAADAWALDGALAGADKPIEPGARRALAEKLARAGGWVTDKGEIADASTRPQPEQVTAARLMADPLFRSLVVTSDDVEAAIQSGIQQRHAAAQQREAQEAASDAAFLRLFGRN